MRIGGSNVISRLQQCCDEGTPAVILSLTRSTVSKARFSSLTGMGESLLFELAEGSQADFEPLSLCCVSYVQGGRGWLFVASVREFWHGDTDDEVRLVVRTPECVTATEARQSLRVPVEPGSGLGVEIHDAEGQPIAARPVDISLGGMLIMFPQNALPDLPVGKALTVALRLGGDAVTIDAVVQRRDGASYGLRFPSFFPHDSSHLPEPYRNIVRALEKRWLRSRRATHRAGA
jgi:hypothetical protein